VRTTRGRSRLGEQFPRTPRSSTSKGCGPGGGVSGGLADFKDERPKIALTIESLRSSAPTLPWRGRNTVTPAGGGAPVLRAAHGHHVKQDGRCR